MSRVRTVARAVLPSPLRHALRQRALVAARRVLAVAGEGDGEWRPWPRTLPRSRLGDDGAPASTALHARMPQDERAEVVAQLKSGWRLDVPGFPGLPAQRVAAGDLWRDAAPEDRRRLELALAVHLRLPRTLAATGLTPDEPPHDVHAMARGPLAAGGSTYHADLVLDALDAAGAAMAPGDAALDFGCSSGRVVRVLAALRPDVRWHGCDPNARAIDWASAHLEGIEFRRSPQAPPLAHPDETFGLVYAISVWSHFGPSAAGTWLREMHRLIRPGGLLVLTAHGLTSLAFTESGRYPAARTLAVRDALLSAGFSFHDDFGKRGDWGVHDPDWGTSYLTPEWLLSEATPAWSVRAFAPGRNEGNQDVYVLARS